jgi:hypothetical protein
MLAVVYVLVSYAFVTGYGTVDGRPVCVYSQDFTIFGGSLGEVYGEKIVKVLDLAMRTGCPVIDHCRWRWSGGDDPAARSDLPQNLPRCLVHLPLLGHGVGHLRFPIVVGARCQHHGQRHSGSDPSPSRSYLHRPPPSGRSCRLCIRLHARLPLPGCASGRERPRARSSQTVRRT